MKQGRTLDELAHAVQQAEEMKRDYVSPASQLKMVDEQNFDFNGRQYEATNHAISQIAEAYSIPGAYLTRLRKELPEVAVANVNGWMKRDNSRHLIRTMEVSTDLAEGIVAPKMRAFLSDRYRPLDNYDLMLAALPTMRSLDLTMRSAELTENKLYLKATQPMLQGEVKRGDFVEAGIEISNSEIGMGAVSISWMFMRLVCLNGMRLPVRSRKYHIGAKREMDGDSIEEYLSNETKALEDRAYWNKFRDVLVAAFTPENFERELAKMKNATEQRLEGNIEKIVEVTSKRFKLTEQQGQSVLENLIRDGELTRWGLANAVTRLANDTEKYDDASELEGIGGEIIELPKAAWLEIANAT